MPGVETESGRAVTRMPAYTYTMFRALEMVHQAQIVRTPNSFRRAINGRNNGGTVGAPVQDHLVWLMSNGHIGLRPARYYPELYLSDDGETLYGLLRDEHFRRMKAGRHA